MKSVRQFILPFAIALASAPAVEAVVPNRLFEVAITRFTSLPNGRATLEYGLLATNGQLRVTGLL